MMSETKPCSGCTVGQAGAAVSRRDFVTLATLSAVAVTLTACGGGSDTGLAGPVPPGSGPVSVPPGAGAAVVRLADFPALDAVGGVARVISTPPVAVARTATSTFVAFSMLCTHQGTLVNINNDGTIRCPNHGAAFTSAGVWTGGQPTTNLVRLPVQVDALGNATITL